jgi:hypothetical protein
MTSPEGDAALTREMQEGMEALWAWLSTQTGAVTALSLAGVLISYLVYRDNAKTSGSNSWFASARSH